jgi:hypothetical protein
VRGEEVAFGEEGQQQREKEEFVFVALDRRGGRACSGGRRRLVRVQSEREGKETVEFFPQRIAHEPS